MGLLNTPIQNLRNMADDFPRGPQYDFAQALVTERDNLHKRLEALLGSFLTIKQGEPPVIKARMKALPGSVIDAGTIDGRVIAGRLNKAAQTFNSNITFSSTDHDTVAWTSGTIQFVDGAKYAISSGNTGNMTAHTFVFFDPAISTSVLQVTTDYADTLQENAIILCNAQNSGSGDLEAFFVSYNSANLNVNQLSVNVLSALSANMGDLTTGTITLSDASSYIRFGTTPPTSATVGTGLWIDRTGLYGLASNVQTFVLSATDGSLKLRSSTGTKYIDIGVGNANEMTFYESGSPVVRIGSSVYSTRPGIYLAGVLSVVAPFSDPGIRVTNAIDSGEGLYATVTGAAGSPIAVRGEAIGAASNNYAIYGSAANGSVNWAGYFDGGNVHITNQLEIAIATGTSPLAITSTTVCTNLNADLLDGSHASAFATIAGTNTFTGNLQISTNGSTTANPRIGAFVDLTTGEATRWQFGDAYNAFQLSFDGRLQIYSFWGIEMIGSRQALTTPSYVTGASGDPCVSFLSPAAGRTVLVTKAAASQTGDLHQWQDSTGSVLSRITSAGAWNGVAIGAAYGGTGLTTWTAAGSLLYSTSATALATLGIAAAGNVLTSSGTAPQWSAGYPASAWGSLTAFSPDALYLVTSGVNPTQEVKKRTITVNGVTVTVLVID